MNYRHAYHAGNFADVLKHAVFARVIEYMKRKDAPFRVIDTHAGAGRYSLASTEAGKTGEWRDGIGRLLGTGAKPLSPAAEAFFAPYLGAVRAENPGGMLEVYPGSPRIALRLMRPQDMLIANELHPEDLSHLRSAMGRDRRVKVLALDGWTALKALLPPKERRGVILIDPPYEEEGELSRVTEALTQGLKRFAGGTFIAWYPIKDPKSAFKFRDTLAVLENAEPLVIELMVRRPNDPDRLNGCGLVLTNPPYTLRAELDTVMPELRSRFRQGDTSHSQRTLRSGARRAGAGGRVRRR
jgi:23S rRNA (adenine2030-N6)-methyltransferase